MPSFTLLKPLPRLRAENHEARQRIRELEEENRRLQQRVEEVMCFLLREMEELKRQVEKEGEPQLLLCVLGVMQKQQLITAPSFI